MKNESTFFQVENKKIGLDHQVYFIADIAANHDGDIERAKDLIYLAAESGADAAKFQHFEARTIVSDFGFENLQNNNSHQSKWNKSVYQVYDEAAVNIKWTSILKETCLKANISFFSTPYSFSLLDHPGFDVSVLISKIFSFGSFTKKVSCSYLVPLNLK